MVTVREPVLNPVPILKLRPTQITVGMREVEAKRQKWRAERDGKAAEFLGQHMIPVVLGPKGRNYIIDHHHLALALYKEGVEAVLVTVTSDLSRLGPEAFWFFLDNRGLSHPYGAKGTREPHDQIPKTVEGLIDDPFRSLAGELRLAGGYSKETAPFSEFLWADFLRRRLKQKLLENEFEQAIESALSLAKSEEASYLPGWCGPSGN